MSSDDQTAQLTTGAAAAAQTDTPAQSVAAADTHAQSSPLSSQEALGAPADGAHSAATSNGIVKTNADDAAAAAAAAPAVASTSIDSAAPSGQEVSVSDVQASNAGSEAPQVGTEFQPNAVEAKPVAVETQSVAAASASEGKPLDPSSQDAVTLAASFVSAAAQDTVPQSADALPPPSLAAEILDPQPEARIASPPNTAPTPVAPLAAAASPQTPALHSHVPPKKFTSLNVNKIFLEKAHPTSSPGLTAAMPSTPKASPGTAASPASSRLAPTPSTASRLTSAKLSAAGKPQPAGWASPVAASPKAAQPLPASSAAPSSPLAGGPLPAAASVSSIATTLAPTTNSTAASPATPANPTPAQPSPTPRFSAALVSKNRSSSPHPIGSPADQAHAKGSPGLRNAVLGSMNRSSSPAGGAGGSSGSASLAPWANLKSSTASPAAATAYANPDFPTAAEAAAFKKAQEERERQEAAEAAARHEEHLRSLDSFRGTAIGSGKHWDEIDDEDGGFLDEVVEFADGTQYKVSTQVHAASGDGSQEQNDSSQELVSKENRFKDVDHDRTWPPKASTPSHAPQPPPPVTQSRRAAVRETLEILPGSASLSLDGPRGLVDGMGSRNGWSQRHRFERDGGFDPEEHRRRGSRGAADRPANVEAVRAWGPLAVRQQSLNPNAPKQAPPPAASRPSTEAMSPSSSAPSAADLVSPPRQEPLPLSTDVAAAAPPASAVRVLSPPNRSAASASPAQANLTGRALPPHLALQQQRAGGSPYAAPPAADRGPTAGPTRPAWGPMSEPRRSALSPPRAEKEAEAAAPASTAPQPTASATPEAPAEAKAPEKPVDQHHEMLSAAERARKRRQEEEAQRGAERERARLKALAIEEKMRKAAEEKEAAARAAREKAEEEARRKREEEEARKREEERLAAERAAAEQAKKKAEAQAEAERKANVWRPRILRNHEEITKSGGIVPASGSQERHHPHPGQQAHGKSSTRGPHPQATPVTPAPGSPPAVASPSEEAASWRRQKPLPPPAPAPETRKRSPSATATAAAELKRSPPRTVLRRPAGPAPTSAEGMANLDDVIGRIRVAMQSGHEPSAAIQLPEAAQQELASATSSQRPTAAAVPSSTAPQPPRPAASAERAASKGSPAPAVDVDVASSISAGTNQSARSQQPRQSAKHLAVPGSAQQGANEPLQPQRTVQRTVWRPTAPEPLVTRQEPPPEQPPVWNKFKISVNSSGKRQRLSPYHLKAQKARVAEWVRSDAAPPTRPYVLTWDPPMAALSTRTLNRDDQFFAKKFCKGTIITPVSLPKGRLARGAPAVLLPVSQESQTKAAADIAGDGRRLSQSRVAVKLPGSTRANKGAGASATESTEQQNKGMPRHPLWDPRPDVPTEPASMRSRGSAGPQAQPQDPNAAAGAGFSSRSRFGEEPLATTGLGSAASPFDLSGLAILPRAPSKSAGNAFASELSATRPELEFGKPRRDSGSGVAFSHKAAAIGSGRFGAERDFGAASPVTFMVTSELEPAPSRGFDGNDAASAFAEGLRSASRSKPSSVGLSPSPESRTHSSAQTPLLAGTGLGSSTWGQGPLAFLDTPSRNPPSSEYEHDHAQGRIKEVWSRPDGNSSNVLAPTQNSLRDIGDDFLPATLSMSLNDLKVDEPALERPDQAASEAAHLGDRSRSFPRAHFNAHAHPHAPQRNAHSGRRDSGANATGSPRLARSSAQARWAAATDGPGPHGRHHQAPHQHDNAQHGAAARGHSSFSGRYLGNSGGGNRHNASSYQYGSGLNAASGDLHPHGQQQPQRSASAFVDEMRSDPRPLGEATAYGASSRDAFSLSAPASDTGNNATPYGNWAPLSMESSAASPFASPSRAKGGRAEAGSGSEALGFAAPPAGAAGSASASPSGSRMPFAHNHRPGAHDGSHAASTGGKPHGYMHRGGGSAAGAAGAGGNYRMYAQHQQHQQQHYPHAYDSSASSGAHSQPQASQPDYTGGLFGRGGGGSTSAMSGRDGSYADSSSSSGGHVPRANWRKPGSGSYRGGGPGSRNVHVNVNANVPVHDETGRPSPSSGMGSSAGAAGDAAEVRG